MNSLAIVLKKDIVEVVVRLRWQMGDLSYVNRSVVRKNSDCR